MYIAFPFQIDSLGFAAEAGYASHVEQMVEQILFTRPGERPNLPEFGCGIQAMIFGPASPKLAAAVRARIEASIQRWIPGVLQLEAVEVLQEDSTLEIHLRYMLLRSGERQYRVFRL